LDDFWRTEFFATIRTAEIIRLSILLQADRGLRIDFHAANGIDSHDLVLSTVAALQTIFWHSIKNASDHFLRKQSDA
jgi:hypothetical protein